MEDWKDFWKNIASDIRLKFKEVNKEFDGSEPKEWKKRTIEDFLDHLEQEVQKQIATSEEKAKLFGLTKERAKEFTAIDYSNFYRIFQGNESKRSKGRQSTKDAFAVYLGYPSAESYLKNSKIFNALNAWKQQVKEQPKWNPVQLLLKPELSKPELYQPIYLSPLDRKAKLMTYEAGEMREFQLAQSMHKGSSEAISIHSLLTDVSPWSVLIGVPGSGKTSSMKWLLQQITQGHNADYEYALYLSLADLDDYLQQFPQSSVYAAFFYIYLHYGQEEAESTGLLLQRRVSHKDVSILFLLDGLDEVVPERRRFIVNHTYRTLQLGFR